MARKNCRPGCEMEHFPEQPSYPSKTFFGVGSAALRLQLPLRLPMALSVSSCAPERARGKYFPRMGDMPRLV